MHFEENAGLHTVRFIQMLIIYLCLHGSKKIRTVCRNKNLLQCAGIPGGDERKME